MGNFIPIFS